MMPRFQFGAGGDRGFWIILGLLLLAVILPTAGLLFFINEAVTSQRDLARQQLGNAYRGQLRLVGERIDSFWEQRGRDLDARTDAESPAVFFEHCVRDGLADSVICLNRDGSPAYPSLAAPPQSDPTLFAAEWVEARRLEDSGQRAQAAEKYDRLSSDARDPSVAARAAQAAIRCLAGTGRKQDALHAIEEHFNLRLSYAADLQGRVIAGDEYLLYLQLLSPDDARYQTQAQRLFGLLQNYARPVPSSQRLFLMDQMRALPVRKNLKTFSTYQAERLAERVLSESRAVPGESALGQSGVANIWKLTSPRSKTIGLYTTETLLADMRRFLLAPGTPQDPEIAVTPPGQPLPPGPQEVGVDAGAHLPGWRISLNSVDRASGSLARRQIATYVWIGCLTIAAVTVLAILGGQRLRRQMRIAHLKTDLVAAVSHELKTPLASMKLLVESLLSGEQFEPARTRQYLELVARENSRLSRLIDNFLTFSRMERNRGKFDFARVQPESVVRAAIDSIGGRYPVDVQIAAGVPPLYADEDALVTVLLNLLDNAYKYTHDDRHIELRIFTAGGRVYFAVQDNGIGLAERDRKKIFRRFYQVDRRLARQSGGVGLGLSIVEFIVKAHQGAVDVVSRPGSGSTFTVSLPPSSSAAGVAA